jgi:hypothetical protein
MKYPAQANFRLSPRGCVASGSIASPAHSAGTQATGFPRQKKAAVMAGRNTRRDDQEVPVLAHPFRPSDPPSLLKSRRLMGLLCRRLCHRFAFSKAHSDGNGGMQWAQNNCSVSLSQMPIVMVWPHPAQVIGLIPASPPHHGCDTLHPAHGFQRLDGSCLSPFTTERIQLS